MDSALRGARRPQSASPRRDNAFGSFGLLGEFERVEQASFDVVRLELNRAILNGREAVVVSTLHVQREPRTLRAGFLKAATAAARHDVAHAVLLVDGHVENRPGAFVTVNVAGEGNV